MRSIDSSDPAGPALRYERTLSNSAQEIWDAVSTGEGLATWIGALRGSVKKDSLEFAMTAEGEAAPWVPVKVERCEAPKTFVVSLDGGMGAWRFHLSLHEDGSDTLLVFKHQMEELALLKPYGSGWDYYLDRLEVALAGGDVTSIDWEAVNAASAPQWDALIDQALRA